MLRPGLLYIVGLVVVGITLACGVEKGASVKELPVEATDDTTDQEEPTNATNELTAQIGTTSYTIIRAWIPPDETKIYFSDQEVNGCKDEDPSYIFTLSALPDSVGEVGAETIVKLIFDPKDSDAFTGFVGTLSLDLVSSTHSDGVIDIGVGSGDQLRSLKGTFSISKCAELVTDAGADDTADDTGDTDGTITTIVGKELHFTWITSCDEISKLQHQIQFKDDKTFILNTALYADAECTLMEALQSRQGIYALNTATTTVGKSLDMNYDTATITLYTSNAITSAITASFPGDALGVTGLCGKTDWVVDTSADVSSAPECFPYNTALVHSTREDRLIYDIADTGELQMSAFRSNIYETEAVSNSADRGSALSVTFSKGNLPTP